MKRTHGHPALDLRVQIVSAMVEPLVRMARVCGLRLDELHEIVTQSYFLELKDRGLSWQQIGCRLGKSRTVVADIAKRTSVTRHPLEGSEPLALRRRIVGLLARRGALSLGAICTGIPKPRTAVLEQLGVLVEQSILHEQDGQYDFAAGVLDLTGAEAAKRVAALRHFLAATSEIVFQRFLGGPVRAAGLAHVLTFRCEDPTRVATDFEAAYRRIERVATSEDSRATARGAHREGSAVFAFAPSPEGFPWDLTREK